MKMVDNICKLTPHPGYVRIKKKVKKLRIP